ncbi:RHS repeat domain-containing protein [Myroides odoratimimus]|uniref:RHS repeat domain-containing protein n=1 Tax=Myroides odoratimimus TaxID=76832 RepID=UPI002DBBDA0E|nr:RHS repeat domain-containing protein [Myroides odoratimimus]MEC4051323.1 RHS repeat domain-containing protein [Myroides odoratimimus]
MKKVKIALFTVIMGTIGVSCNSSDNEPYKPDPNKGDFVKVARMTVSSDGNKEHLVETRYDIEYNNFLKLRKISEYKNYNELEAPSNPLLKYEFDYLKNNALNSIVITTDEGVEYDKLIASYKNDYLNDLTGKKSSFVYEHSSGNVVKAISGEKAYNYSYDNRGNLTSVSDATGELFTYTYGTGNNPFMYSEYNLTFDYVPGGELIRFVQSSKNNIETATNKKTGEVYTFKTTASHEFGFPTRIEVKGKDSFKLFKFDYVIIREPEK